MRVALLTIGTAGDIHPFIGVGLALQRRGHEVVLVTNPHFQERIARVGLGFWPLGTADEHKALVSSPSLIHRSQGPMFVLHNLMIPAIEPSVRALEHLRMAFKPDAVLAHHIVLAAPHTCERLRIPCATAVLAPLFWLSRHEPIVYPNIRIENLPRWADRAARRVMRPAARVMIDRPVSRAKKAIGLPPARNLVYTEARGQNPDRPVLALWSRQFRPAMPDDPERGRICGFGWFDRGATTHKPDEAELDRFIAEGEPPLVFTLGTSVVHHGQDFFDLAAKAAARLGRRALLLTGSRESAIRNWPAGVRAVPYAAFSRVLPAGCCTIHHGGIGTTAQAMRAGRPAVIIPFANDEFDNAARARRLGVSVTLPRRRLKLRTLCEAIDRAATDAAMRGTAAVLGQKLIAEDGAAVAAEELERLARGRDR
ncbi:MAG: glycosyltransferase family 1 protein [Phycisphaerales bacterium]|nr:glycosyltransferase family 1 protein [Phycisphaerales bacterium]